MLEIPIGGGYTSTIEQISSLLTMPITFLIVWYILTRLGVVSSVREMVEHSTRLFLAQTSQIEDASQSRDTNDVGK